LDPLPYRDAGRIVTIVESLSDWTRAFPNSCRFKSAAAR
jgi:hypothetical protein